jgi:hypothetical protein
MEPPSTLNWERGMIREINSQHPTQCLGVKVAGNPVIDESAELGKIVATIVRNSRPPGEDESS